MDYSNRNYRTTNYSINRKRKIIDAMVNDLHEQYFDMIEQALAHSDLQEAKTILKYIMEKL